MVDTEDCIFRFDCNTMAGYKTFCHDDDLPKEIVSLVRSIAWGVEFNANKRKNQVQYSIFTQAPDGHNIDLYILATELVGCEGKRSCKSTSPLINWSVKGLGVESIASSLRDFANSLEDHKCK